MDGISGNNMRNQYKKRDDLSSLSYYDRKNHTYRQGNQKDSVPYSVGFRLRIVLCIVLFLSFLFSNYFIFEEKETQVIYQKLEENTSGDDLKNYAVTAFEEFKKN